MIEAHDLNVNPSAPDPYDVPSDYATRGVYDELGKMTQLLDRIANFSERQRERAAPDVIDLSPSQGQPQSNTYTVKNKLRVLGILITGAQGDRLQLLIGSRQFNFFNVTGGPVYIPFPVSIDVGIDLSIKDVTNAGAVNWSAYVFGYPEF